MNQAVPLYVVLVVLAGIGLLYLAYRFAQVIESTRRILGVAIEAVGKLSATLHQLHEAVAPATEEFRVNMASVPELLKAVTRVGEAQLGVAQQQRLEQEQRARNPFGRPNAPAPPRDTAAANLEDEVTRMMRSEGISREEALMRMNPANAQSVFEGSRLFDDWGR